MADEVKKPSALQQRINAGKAEPISERERDQLLQLRAIHAKRFGRDAEQRLANLLRSA